MLSGDGDHPMTKLSDTQAVILSAASQRDDGAVLPLPETLKLKGGARRQGPRQPQGQGPDRSSGRTARRRPAAAAHHPRRPRGHRRRAEDTRQHAGPGHGRADRAPLTRRRRPRQARSRRRPPSRHRPPRRPQRPSARPRRPRRGQAGQGRAGRQAHAARRHQAGPA